MSQVLDKAGKLGSENVSSFSSYFFRFIARDIDIWVKLCITAVWLRHIFDIAFTFVSQHFFLPPCLTDLGLCILVLCYQNYCLITFLWISHNTVHIDFGNLVNVFPFFNPTYCFYIWKDVRVIYREEAWKKSN